MSDDDAGRAALNPDPSDRPWLARFAASRVGRIVLALLVVLAIALAVDGIRAPQDQLGVRLAVAAIGAYQATASPALGMLGIKCRFEPTCSHYGRAAIEHRGLVPGALLSARRIVRCGPWTKAGTVDPPPR